MKVVRVPLSQIECDTDQPRRTFEEIGELAASILKQGLLEPLKVVQKTPKRYLLIDGERRYRALQLLTKTDNAYLSANCIVIQVPDNKVLTQLAFDVHKNKIPHLEEAEAYKRLLESGMTIADIACAIGKRQNYVRDKVKLIAFSETTKRLIREKKLPAQLLYSLDIDKVKDAEDDIIRRIQSEKPSKGEVRRIVIEETERLGALFDHFVLDCEKFSRRTQDFLRRSEKLKMPEMESHFGKSLQEVLRIVRDATYHCNKLDRVKEETRQIKSLLEELHARYGKGAELSQEMIASHTDSTHDTNSSRGRKRYDDGVG